MLNSLNHDVIGSEHIEMHSWVDHWMWSFVLMVLMMHFVHMFEVCNTTVWTLMWKIIILVCITSFGNTTHSSNYKMRILSSPRSGIAVIYLTIYAKSSFMQKIIFLCKFELFSIFLRLISRFNFMFNLGFVSFQPQCLRHCWL